MPDVEVWRRAAVALAEHACGYQMGRSKDDPVYIEVTEGRDGPGPVQRKSYSSCGDLAAYMWWRLGCREPWVNREERTPAPGDWRTQKNVTALTYGEAFKAGVSREPKPDEMPAPGDVILVWLNGYDVHVMVALEDGVQGSTLKTANYGAGGMTSGSWPGARIGGAKLSWVGTGASRKLHYAHKIVHRIIRLEDMLPLFTEPPNFGAAAVSFEDRVALEAAVTKPNQPPPPPSRPLRRGSGMPKYPAEAETVRRLQARLNELGAHPRLVVDGNFGAATEMALMVEQRKLGIDDDGILGKLSKAALKI